MKILLMMILALASINVYAIDNNDKSSHNNPILLSCDCDRNTTQDNQQRS